MSGPCQVWFSLEPKFNSFELDSEVGRLVSFSNWREMGKVLLEKDKRIKGFIVLLSFSKRTISIQTLLGVLLKRIFYYLILFAHPQFFKRTHELSSLSVYEAADCKCQGWAGSRSNTRAHWANAGPSSSPIISLVTDLCYDGLTSVPRAQSSNISNISNKQSKESIFEFRIFHSSFKLKEV